MTATATPPGTHDAVPTGWYDDPYGTDAERFHQGTRWTGRTRVPTSPEATADRPAFPQAPSRPRPTWQRLLITAPAGAVALVAAVNPLPRPWGYVVAGVVCAAVVATAGRRVSYGWVSVLGSLVVVPYGAAAVVDVIWRLTYLPYRDWERDWEQVDDDPNWARVTHQSAKGPLWIHRDCIDAGAETSRSKVP